MSDSNRRLFIVASQGPDRGLAEALRRLTPASVTELAVESLDLTATAELAAALLGGPPAPGLVRNLHARTGGAVAPALTRTRAVDPLTGREREIAALAASGARNGEIAERLHVSVRTVGTHLHRIYRKLGVTGRDELAQALGPGT